MSKIDKQTPEHQYLKRRNKLKLYINSIIWNIIILIYFILSFFFNSFLYTWLIFIIAIVCSNIVSIVFLVTENAEKRI